MIARDAVVAEARLWVGVPWVHQGRSLHGIDCIGLIVVVCRALAISDYDIGAYPREPIGTEFMQHFIAGGGTRIGILAAQPGDLLLLRDGRYPCHVGIITDRGGEPALIHANAKHRKVVEEYLTADLRERRIAAIAMPGVG